MRKIKINQVYILKTHLLKKHVHEKIFILANSINKRAKNLHKIVVVGRKYRQKNIEGKRKMARKTPLEKIRN